ncbi:MAG: copper chaperone PCu(A)C [Chloroflexi bacterium]|nr:copper chaperone PCu(A)C [Chloroflexota bacterium]
MAENVGNTRKWLFIGIGVAVFLVVGIIAVGLVFSGDGDDDDDGDNGDNGDNNGAEEIVITEGELTVTGAWMRAVIVGDAPVTVPEDRELDADEAPGEGMSDMGMGGSNAAVYLVIANGTEADDSLVAASVSAEIATEAQLHDSVMVGDERQMQQQDAIPVPAGEVVELKERSLHVMLMNVQQDLNTDETITLTLTFESGTTLDIPVQVVPLGTEPTQ